MLAVRSRKPGAELRFAIEIEPDESRRRHLEALRLKLAGVPVPEIIARTGVPRSSIHRYCAEYRKHGIFGLSVGTAGSRPKTLIDHRLMPLLVRRREIWPPTETEIATWRRVTEGRYTRLRLLRWAYQAHKNGLGGIRAPRRFTPDLTLFYWAVAGYTMREIVRGLHDDPSWCIRSWDSHGFWRDVYIHERISCAALAGPVAGGAAVGRLLRNLRKMRTVDN